MELLVNINTKLKNNVVIIGMILFYSFINGQGIKQSHHDFKSVSWNGSDYCKPCHTPIKKTVAVSKAPLWNHKLKHTVFEMYTSLTLDGYTEQPSGSTAMCLSCHDGTLAIENQQGNTNEVLFENSNKNFHNLKNHHPVSLDYNSSMAVKDSKLHDPSTAPSGLGGTIEQDLLKDGRVECISCHDVHISRNTEGCIGCHKLNGTIIGPATKSLSLWKSNDGSSLCFTCHKK